MGDTLGICLAGDEQCGMGSASEDMHEMEGLSWMGQSGHGTDGLGGTSREECRGVGGLLWT